MQHTDKYNLNIIETADAFGPEALNENARTLETQLAALDAGKAAQTDFEALAGQVGTLEAGRLYWKLGTYFGSNRYGSGGSNILTFDFKPIAIIILNTSNAFHGGHLWVRGAYRGCAQSSASSYSTVIWGDRTVEWYGDSASAQLNNSNNSYAYLALGTVD